MSAGEEWQYAPARTLRGALQRGHGVAALALRDQPEKAELVYECTSRDTRWDGVDDRDTYLARLLRDMRLDPAPVVAQLLSGDADEDRLYFTVGILERMALAGDETARDALLDYVRSGTHWIDVVETVSWRWPHDWWDGLWETAARRLKPEDASWLSVRSPLWQRWRDRDSRIGVVLGAAEEAGGVARARVDDLAAASDAELVSLLRTAGIDRSAVGEVLGQLRRRKRPVPDVLEVVEQIAPLNPPSLHGVLRLVGPPVVGPARTWAVNPDHPLHHSAPHLLAVLGDDADIPVLLAAIDQMDDWCGYDTLTEGLARILSCSPAAAHGDAKVALLKRLRWLTIASPHSYERASYLRSLLLLNPDVAHHLSACLFDCEPAVRLLAIQHVPLTDDTRRWLMELHGDPIEDDDVRQAAADRLAPAEEQV